MDASMSIYFGPGDFQVSDKVYGRISANNSMLKALIRYGNFSHLSLYMHQIEFFEAFKSGYAEEIRHSSKTFHPILWGDLPSLQHTNCYLAGDPLISHMSWARSYLNPAAFSLCGLTHTMSEYRFAEEVGKIINGPVYDWDAIVCTSTAIKKVMENLFAQWMEYLGSRHKIAMQRNLQLPVIPLGINPEEFATGEMRTLMRNKFRERYNIAAEDYVVLFFGRLFFYEKAHPVPMYIALEELAKRVGKKNHIHFVQAGWFEDVNDLNHYEDAAKLFCPSVNTIFINDIDSEEKKKSIWPGADVFISLSDNIQESFGITPLEAMANKLPVIVSDWDGYKDTVRHQVDGFRIPAVMPPAGCGVDLSLGYITKAVTYRIYSGLTSQMIGIDIGCCVDALWELYQSIELRMRMGESGYQRVQEQYHWREVIRQYEVLWSELSARRQAAVMDDKKPIAIPPVLADPYLTYRGYGSTELQPNQYLELGSTAISQLAVLASHPIGRLGVQQRLSVANLEKILVHVQNGLTTVQEVVAMITTLDMSISSGIVARSLVYLVKFDFLRLGQY